MELESPTVCKCSEPDICVCSVTAHVRIDLDVRNDLYLTFEQAFEKIKAIAVTL